MIPVLDDEELEVLECLLQRVKEIDANVFTKSGIMLGLGETTDEVLQVMDDLRSAAVDFLTIGQYLQPSANHLPVQRWVTPEQFAAYADVCKTPDAYLKLAQARMKAGDAASFCAVEGMYAVIAK